jgi:hypothetical protein
MEGLLGGGLFPLETGGLFGGLSFPFDSGCFDNTGDTFLFDMDGSSVSVGLVFGDSFCVVTEVLLPSCIVCDSSSSGLNSGSLNGSFISESLGLFRLGSTTLLIRVSFSAGRTTNILQFFAKRIVILIVDFGIFTASLTNSLD